MDFMKVLDQTVREIKREVNLKVLKVPEIEQKVLDATSDEPWGPHGSALSEIAQATKKFTECQMIMNVLWMRLTEAGANWRHVYKALTVIEYLIANGSERALDDILEHGFRIASLSGFEYVEPNGKDVGINVRKKVETLVGTINDKEKVQSVRSKAAATRDKYFGLSSSGVTYKSSASSYGSSDRYGGFGNSNDGDSFKDSYKDNDRYGRDTKSDNEYGDSKSKGDKSKKGATQHSRGTSSDSSVKTSTVAADIDEDDFDDFDPRGSSTSGTKNVASNQVDLFGGSLIDFMDEPTSVPTESKNVNNSATTEVDLFADATFVSASPEPQGTSSSRDQAKVDLFANQPAFPAAPAAAPVSADVDLFGASDSYLFAKPNQSVSEAKSTNNFDPFAISGSSSSISKDTKSPVSGAKNTQTFDPFAISGSSSSISKDTKTPVSEAKNTQTFDPFAISDSNTPRDTKSPVSASTNTATFDPFAAIPMNNFEESDSFGDFTSHAESETTRPKQNVVNSVEQSSKPAVKKGGFQVKSGIWADSLSRGIIDLNITASKKTNLADIGIVGGLDESQEEKEKGLPTTWYMGKAMGPGMGLNKGASGNFSAYASQDFRRN